MISNDKVNYLNWAIGHMIYRHMSNNECCLRYKRKIVASRNAIRKINAREFSEDSPLMLDDDAFADEQYVLVGMRYRVVRALSSWPAPNRFARNRYQDNIER